MLKTYFQGRGPLQIGKEMRSLFTETDHKDTADSFNKNMQNAPQSPGIQLPCSHWKHESGCPAANSTPQYPETLKNVKLAVQIILTKKKKERRWLDP